MPLPHARYAGCECTRVWKKPPSIDIRFEPLTVQPTTTSTTSVVARTVRLVCGGGVLPTAIARLVIRNDVPRLAVDGSQIDCHSGNIVYHGGQYVMVGEMYKNCGKANETPCLYPKIVTYSSPDLEHWIFRGEALGGVYPNAPFGVQNTPWILPPNTNNVNWYVHACWRCLVAVRCGGWLASWWWWFSERWWLQADGRLGTVAVE
jgi:hypothetical protein